MTELVRVTILVDPKDLEISASIESEPDMYGTGNSPTVYSVHFSSVYMSSLGHELVDFDEDKLSRYVIENREDFL